MQMLDAVHVKDVVKTYPGGVRALDGVSFSIHEGEIFGLLGPNGAGKSTAVKILTTLSRPDSGEAQVAGFDVVRQPGNVRQAIGVVGQKSGVDREATGRENLILQGQLYGLHGRQLRVRVDELLERFGLIEAAGRLARTYSGGMQRRLDIAMGLVHSPRVLFLDEPTTGLDPEIRGEMWQEITRLSQSEGLTILLTTHYLEEADQLAARLAIVDSGRVVTEGTPDHLKSQLRGDAIHIELDQPVENGRAQVLLGRLDSMREILSEGKSLHAFVDNGGRTVPLIIQTLELEGINVASITVSRPSLDDVYLQYTGKSFEQADTEQGRP